MSASEEIAPIEPTVEPTETETVATPEPAPEPAEETAAPESPEATPAPEASSAPKLSALERGKLRALGMGNLITRLETSEGQLAAAHGQIETLKAENARLKAGREAEEKAAREKIEAAAKGRENEVSKGVREKLSALGVPETDAPSAASTAEGQTLTRAEFDKLDFTARNQFVRNGGKIVS
jgi:hypothetical protein